MLVVSSPYIVFRHAFAVHRARSVDGMQSDKRAGNAHGKHGSHLAGRAEIKQSGHRVGGAKG